MKQSITIQPIHARHARAVADIHVASQEGTFLTSLGRDFLTALYKQMSQSEYSVSYVAIHNDEVVGFIVGSLQLKAIFKEVIVKRFFQLVWLVFKRSLSRPALLWQALKTLAYPGQQAKGTPEAELLALALQPGWRNNGIGGQLVQQFIKGMKEAGVDRIAVTVDGNNNGALRFYRRYGFEPAFNFEMYGRPMVNLIVNLR